MWRIGRQLVSVVTVLGVTGLAVAQTSPGGAAPGTVPVPKSGQDKSGFGTASPAPAPSKPAASRPAPIQDTKRFADHTGLARTSELVGMGVKDADGKDAGKIEDLLVGARGAIAYAVVSFGGLLGVGDKLYAVPWDAVMVDREQKVVHLNVNKSVLERAPSFSKDRWPEATDREWGREVRSSWSDASITASVKTRLARAKPATLTKVNVDTSQGVVQLTGTVDSERTKERATELARQVDGVQKVVNNLKVQG